MSGHGVMPGSYDSLRVSELAPGQTVEIRTVDGVKLWLTKADRAKEQRGWMHMVSLHVSDGHLARVSRTDPRNVAVRDPICVGECWLVMVDGSRMSTAKVMQITIEW